MNSGHGGLPRARCDRTGRILRVIPRLSNDALRPVTKPTPRMRVGHNFSPSSGQTRPRLIPGFKESHQPFIVHRQHGVETLISRSDQLKACIAKRTDDRFGTSRRLRIGSQLPRFKEGPRLMQRVDIAVEDFNDALLQACQR